VEGLVTSTVDELLESIDRAMAALKSRGEERHGGDIENLLRVKRVLEGLDPDEVDALLEDDEDE
jgi:hypothetical protein